MATQRVAFPDDHQGAGNLDLVRQSSHASAERLQPRAKLRTCTLPSEHPDNEINDSQRIVRICAAMNVVLEFIRTAKLRDLEFLISDGTEHLEARATLQSAVEELELLREQLEQLDKENLVLREEVDKVSMFEEIVGTSPALQAVIARVSKVAPTDSAVLITGETGTGKELIARAIHKRSRRSARAFVSVNCGAISAGLVESELFGHVKGAFTGAIANRDGRFKVADGGTILLDEVGDLPPETQVKLLRVLQEHEFEPIGCNKTVKVDVRLIAATNRNLEEDVRAGKFRSDLLYRLNVFPIHVPPLRERREDVPLLVAFLLQTFSQKLGKSVTQVRQDTMRRLMEYSWPGNVRELQNILERAVILSTNNVLVLDREFTLGVDDARAPVATEALWPVTSGASSAASASLRDAERRHIESALAATNWVIEGDKGAARILDIHPNTLRSRMKKLDIDRPCGEAADGESAYRVKPPS
jgi:formate hydrogenlyase transcriptional activator